MNLVLLYFWQGIGPESDDSGESVCDDCVTVEFLGEILCGCKHMFVLDASGNNRSGSGTIG